MTLLLTTLAAALILALLLGTAGRVLEAVGFQPDGRRLPRTPLPTSTSLPRGNLSHPRLIGRRGHAAEPGVGARRALALLALAGSGLLLLLVPLGRDGRHHTVPLTTPVSNTGLPGVGMPGVMPGNTAVKPLAIAIVLGNAYTGVSRARELRALGAWLRANHNPRTRITVIDRAHQRASRPLTAADLEHVRLSRQVPRLTDTVRRVRRGHPDRLLVTIGNFVKPSLANTTTVRVHARREAATATDVELAPGGHRVVDVDPRRRGALAATLARAIISISGMSERR